MMNTGGIKLHQLMLFCVLWVMKA